MSHRGIFNKTHLLLSKTSPSHRLSLRLPPMNGYLNGYMPSLTLGVPHSNYKLQTISQPPSLRQRSLAVFAMFVSLRGISVQTTVLSLVNVPPALYFASSQTTRATRELTSLQLRQRPRHQYARSTGHHPLLDYTLLDGSRGVFDIR